MRPTNKKIAVLNNFTIQLHLIEIYFTACSSIQLIQTEKYIETLHFTWTGNGNVTLLFLERGLV